MLIADQNSPQVGQSILCYFNYLEYDNETDVDRPGVEKSERIVKRLSMHEKTEHGEAEKDIDLN